MGSNPRRPDGFDGSAAVTRSLLGYGVLAGVFYLIVGVTLAVTREGFQLSQHPLSLLMLGENGWMQRTNLIVAGLMTIAAAVGFGRAMRGSRHATRARALLTVYGACLIASGILRPDPMDGFPAGAATDEASLAGLLHLAFGAIGFLSLAMACFVLAAWCSGRSARGWAGSSRTTGTIIVLGFVGGAALASEAAGVALLWVAVVTGWAWLAATSLLLYRTVPHPDPDRRSPAAA